MTRLVEGRRGGQQRLDDAFQNLAVEVFLGLEVVVDVGLGQACLGRDITGLGGSEALVGELLAGCAQDELFVALANAGHKALCFPLPPGGDRTC